MSAEKLREADPMCPECTSDQVAGVEVSSVYDGVLYWLCARCRFAWARDWTGYGRRQAIADEFVAAANRARPEAAS